MKNAYFMFLLCKNDDDNKHLQLRCLNFKKIEIK
jgi:hypothetical protein